MKSLNLKFGKGRFGIKKQFRMGILARNYKVEIDIKNSFYFAGQDISENRYEEYLKSIDGI